MDKIPIVMVGFGSRAGGFTRVVHSLAERLAGDFDIHHLAVNLTQPAPASYPWRMVSSDIPGDWLGEQKLRELIEDVRPRLLWIHNDSWFLVRYRRVLREYAGTVRAVAYMPLDGRIRRTTHLRALAHYDTVVLYTEFARRELEAALSRIAAAHAGFRPPTLEVIPHGVDRGLFAPLAGSYGSVRERRAAARRELLGDESLRGEPFLVLNANQNHNRKRLDVTLEGFAQFARDKPPAVRLYLHCASEPSGGGSQGIDVRALARRLGIADRLVLSSQDGKHPQSSDRELNLIYNACNVGINTSWGEGWGLVSFEHAATGAAQIVPRHTACEELWTGTAELMEVETTRRPLSAMLEARSPTPEAVATALERLYADPQRTEQAAEAAYATATRANYEWDHVADDWRRLFATAV